MKLYGIKGARKGKVLKRKNKRIAVQESVGDSIYVELRTLKHKQGHFAAIGDERGIKYVAMRLSPETAQFMAMMILEHLEMLSNKKF